MVTYNAGPLACQMYHPKQAMFISHCSMADLIGFQLTIIPLQLVSNRL